MGGIVIKSSSLSYHSSLKASSANILTIPHLSDENMPPREDENDHSPRDGIIAGLFTRGVLPLVPEQDYQSSSTRLYATLHNSVDLDLPLENLQITSTSVSSSQ
jgi:hypothetical protein